MKKEPALRVFSVFFHPSASVTAVGGAEKRFREITKFFARKGVRMVVLEPNSSILKRSHNECKVYELSHSFPSADGWVLIYLGWILWALRACFRAVTLVRKEACQILLAPNNTVPNLIPAYFAHLTTRRPLCVITHHLDVFSENVRPNFGENLGMYRMVGYSMSASLAKSVAFLAMTIMLKKANACIAVSRFTAKTLVKLGIAAEKVFVSGNGVDLEPIAKAKAPENKRFDAVFVGRITVEKGVFDLLRTWQEIVKENKSAQLLIIGSGPETQRVKNFVRTARLQNNVIVCDRVGDGTLYGLMKASKVFVFPSRFEGWGLAVAEALACGLPVVCYDIPALKEVFGGCESVFLVPAGNVRELSAITSKIISTEKRERNRLTEASKNYTSRFSWKNVAKKDLQAIRKLSTPMPSERPEARLQCAMQKRY